MVSNSSAETILRKIISFRFSGALVQGAGEGEEVALWTKLSERGKSPGEGRSETAHYKM